MANVEDRSSVSNRLRSARLARFESLISPLRRPVRILDVGGTRLFWEQRGWAGRCEFDITTVNLSAEEQRWPNIRSVAGDATDLAGVPDGSYDVCFSNSVIEHLFTLEKQAQMAREIRRVAPAFWVQTPNFWFPIEPHFHVPGWQWMPVAWRVAILQRKRCGWRGPVADAVKARELVTEVRLLTASGVQRLFPGATIWRERIAGLTKSFVAYSGF